MTFHRALVYVTTLAVVAVVASPLGIAQQPQPAKGRAIDAAQVLSAIDRGKAFLIREQLPRGNWTEFNNFDGGVTALCTLALLNSGVPADDPSVQRAITYR